MANTRARAKQVTYKSDATGGAVRNLHDKLSETVSVKDFGAIGDGVTDDSDNFIAAVAAVNAAGGGLLYIPAGMTVLVSKNITWLSNVHLKIEEGASVKLKDGSADVIRIIDARGDLTDIGFYGPGKIDGNKANQGTNRAHCLAISADDVIVRDLEICNANANAGSMGDGLILEPDVGAGPGAFQCKNVVIDNCYIHDNGRQNITIESGINIKVVNCRLESASSGIDIEISDPTNDTIRDVIVANNYVTNCTNGFAAVSALQPTTCRSITFSDNQILNCTNGYTFRAIKNLAVDGGGVYGSTAYGVYLYTDASTTVDDCSIRNLNIQTNGGYGIRAEDVGGSFTGLEIKGCRVYAGADLPIDILGANRLIINDNYVATSSNRAIKISTCIEALVSNNDIQMTGAGADDRAFFAVASTGVTTIGNKVTGGDYGLCYQGCTTIYIESNEFPKSAFTPIYDLGANTSWYGTFSGTFTMGAATQINVSDKKWNTYSIVDIVPTNSAAATLTAGANMLWIDPAASTANTQFRVKTAGGGSAAGTETFSYILHNPIY